MHLMNDVLQEYFDIFVMVLLYDALAHSKSPFIIWKAFTKFRKRNYTPRYQSANFQWHRSSFWGRKRHQKEFALLKKNFVPSGSGSTPVALGTSGSSWLCEFLLAVHLSLCRNCSPFDTAHQKEWFWLLWPSSVEEPYAAKRRSFFSSNPDSFEILRYTI